MKLYSNYNYGGQQNGWYGPGYHNVPGWFNNQMSSVYVRGGGGGGGGGGFPSDITVMPLRSDGSLCVLDPHFRRPHGSEGNLICLHVSFPADL